jgi:hypothetical protein
VVESVEPSRSAGTRVVSLGAIRCDARAFPRETIDAARVEEFAGLYRDELPAGSDPFPPIGLVEDRDGGLVLYDGWHRVEARQRIAIEHPGRGYDQIAATIVRADGQDPVELAFELAIDCSAIGSKQLTYRERVAAAQRLVEIHPDLSAREIGRRVGISHVTVLRRARGSVGTPEPSFLPAAVDARGAERSQIAHRRTLEQQAWRAANALCELFDDARTASRGRFGLGKPNLARAGAAAYKALERSYGEGAPAVADDLVRLTTAMRDEAKRAA